MDSQRLRDYGAAATGILSAIIFFALLVAVFFVTDPELRKTLLTMMVTAGTGYFGTVVGYYLGSSASSRRKDDTIAGQSQAMRGP